MRFRSHSTDNWSGSYCSRCFFVSHSLHKKPDSIELAKPSNSDIQQQSTPPKPSSPPVQQNTRGANSPNTNIDRNNNTVTNSITVNPPAAETRTPQLTFTDQTDVVSLSLGEGGATFSRSITSLRKMPWQPFVMGAKSPRFSIFADGNTLLVTTSVGGGQFGPVIEVRNNVFAVRDPSFDRNSNEHAFEVVSGDGRPVFQLIQKNPRHVIINGYFPLPNGRPILAGPEGLITNATDEQVSNFRLKPIFKYPPGNTQGSMPSEGSFQISRPISRESRRNRSESSKDEPAGSIPVIRGC